MPKKNELEFANFTLTFGQERVLLDFVEEIVIPAFTSNLNRSYGETTHFFHDVELVDLGNEEAPVLCIVGRYIKNTVVKREQVFSEEDNALVKDDESLNTSPSAIFILILNNHKLLYFSETSYAPSMFSFRVTAESFIKDKYHEFIDNLRQQSRGGLTKKQLYEQYPSPHLEVVPLASEESLSEFINQYSQLKTVEIKLLTTNHELDNNELFREIRKAKNEALSEVTTITHNNGRDGLSKGAVIRQLESAISQGNSRVKLKGKDREGNKLEGTNENFKVRSYVEEVPQTIMGIVVKSYEVFQDLVNRRIINLGETRENTIPKIRQILRSVITRNHNE